MTESQAQLVRETSDPETPIARKVQVLPLWQTGLIKGCIFIMPLSHVITALISIPGKTLHSVSSRAGSVPVAGLFFICSHVMELEWEQGGRVELTYQSTNGIVTSHCNCSLFFPFFFFEQGDSVLQR